MPAPTKHHITTIKASILALIFMVTFNTAIIS